MIINKKKSYFFVLLMQTIKKQWVAGDPMAVNGHCMQICSNATRYKMFVQIESNCSRKHPSCSAGSIRLLGRLRTTFGARLGWCSTSDVTPGDVVDVCFISVRVLRVVLASGKRRRMHVTMSCGNTYVGVLRPGVGDPTLLPYHSYQYL